MSKQLRAGLILTLTALIWGAAFVAQSVGMNYVGPFTYLFSRSVIGGIVLLPIIKFMNKRENTASQPKDNKVLLIGGICCGIALFAGSILQQIGIKYTTVGKAGFITSLYMIIVPIISIFIGKKASKKVWISVAIAIIGMYFLCMNGEKEINSGDIFVLLCAFAFSIHILIIDYFSPKVNGVKLSCIQFWICAAIAFFPMMIFEKPEMSKIIAAWAPILYAGLLSSGVGYTLQIIAQKDIDPTIASLICSLESVFSVLFGWLILKEILSGKELLGCALVFIGVILTQIPEHKKQELIDKG
ncbi:hypothetical protein SDC9_91334 [bioreactor metagenome]|uniref:EamA domain-containing protein n=1 Tax=bioreactor metagenome TaxID=1076179 RepID=A0A644ZUU2_9ZZZZ|nr:DMT family transporter [Candidatus Metalachnospira sp.]